MDLNAAPQHFIFSYYNGEMKNLSRIIFLGSLFFLLAPLAVSASVVCTNLTSDLSYGETDSYSGGPVTLLQNFLFAEGNLSATPNGHFGPATLSAVISFQTARGISSTGYVGPLTRAAIAAESCPSTVSSPTNSTTNVTTNSNAVTPSSNITAPLSGATLSVGQNYTITWNNSNNAGYTIVLENQNGLSQGFITPNTQNSGSFLWQVGNVLSAVTDSYSMVPTGTYRIHLEGVSGNLADLYSGNFNITAPPLSVISITPASISLSGNQTMVLYGSGFNSSVRINIDGYYNLSSSPFYVSPDGTVLVFPLPSSVPVGNHIVDVSNIYGSLATSASFAVTQ